MAPSAERELVKQVVSPNEDNAAAPLDPNINGQNGLESERQASDSYSDVEESSWF